MHQRGEPQRCNPHTPRTMLPEQDFPSVVPGKAYKADGNEKSAMSIYVNTAICVTGSSIPGISRGKSWVRQANASTALGETIEKIQGNAEQNAASNATKNLITSGLAEGAVKAVGVGTRAGASVELLAACTIGSIATEAINLLPSDKSIINGIKEVSEKLDEHTYDPSLVYLDPLTGISHYAGGSRAQSPEAINTRHNQHAENPSTHYGHSSGQEANGGAGYGYELNAPGSGSSNGGTSPAEPGSQGAPEDPHSGNTNGDSNHDADCKGGWKQEYEGMRSCPIDRYSEESNPNPEDNGSSDGPRIPKKAPGEVGGRYYGIFNYASERGGRPAPGSNDGDGPKGPRPWDKSMSMNADDDYGCDPITGPATDGGTEGNIGWNFRKEPPKNGGFGTSGGGYDDLYKPNPEDDWGVGGPSAKTYGSVHTEFEATTIEFVSTMSAEVAML